MAGGVVELSSLSHTQIPHMFGSWEGLGEPTLLARLFFLPWGEGWKLQTFQVVGWQRSKNWGNLDGLFGGFRPGRRGEGGFNGQCSWDLVLELDNPGIDIHVLKKLNEIFVAHLVWMLLVEDDTVSSRCLDLQPPCLRLFLSPIPILRCETMDIRCSPFHLLGAFVLFFRRGKRHFGVLVMPLSTSANDAPCNAALSANATPTRRP